MNYQARTPSAAAELARRLGGKLGADGKNWSARCPAHDDHNPSLSITDGASGQLLVRCHAGCTQEAVIDALRNRELWPQLQALDSARHLTEYIYRTATSEPYLRVRRIDLPDGGKTYPQSRWERGKWVNGKPDGAKIPYRLPELQKSPADVPVFILEGEKCADALAKEGFVATTASEGAGKWNDPELNKWFRGRTVYILPDNDAPGHQHAQQVAQNLCGVASEVRIVELPGLGAGEDIYDWLQRGNIAANLFPLAERAPVYRPSGPKLLTSGEFIRNFVPPDYLIDGMLQRRFIYSITGRTGEGKTAVCLRIAAHVAEGLPLVRAPVVGGRVLYLAGENPDDIRMRWLALTEQMGLDADTVAVDFVDGRFKLSEIPDHTLRAAQEREYALVIVDTSVAFSQSIDENDNVQQLQHAQRLRGLIELLSGGPTILVCCHPPKNAGDENLQPRGGGAVIAEFDGNLTCKKTEAVVEVHWQGKFRGPDFSPVHFMLKSVTSERLKDRNGRLISTVAALPASEQDQEAMERAATADQNKLLRVIEEAPMSSDADLARACQWFMGNGEPYKVKAQRALKALKKLKLVEDEDRVRNGLRITDKGRTALKKTGTCSETTNLPTTERL